MKVPLLDLKAQYAAIREEILRVTEEVYESQYFILGPRVEALEKQIADYTKTTHAVGISSGTDALLVSLMAAGIGAEDRVITSSYSFFATAGCIARLGAYPVFADIDPDTYNISADCIEATIDSMTPMQLQKLKAIVPVHLFGQCADMDPILEIARRYGLAVVEDAAQAIGAEYRGLRAGSIGQMGCFSFFPSKNLGAFGDGGMVTTNSDPLYEELRILRSHGAAPKYHHRRIGGNFRLDALQAAVVSIKLKYLDKWTEGRQKNAATYRKMFEDAKINNYITLPVEKEQRHIYNQFVISVAERRDELKAFLRDAGIGTEVYYPVPLHLQQCFSYLGYEKGDFPAAEHAAAHSLALPIYPELTRDQQQYVVSKIRQFYS
ncbi:MAG: DegT/DnrJ/EryC1/StrS family aminotransferase [Deltaproteobacteria bacterium]|nr:DegT/DnrJ/EryC1/StrS family aminotransferase [Deltaproteobacteria bacterium]MBW1961051.1 DegT/DnrJ/EryC1/StrS family aminotransferase [Deltaproteobacteria bacterium]MBW1993923.1 DegT/DnrJ/EryC1/StrS family aminotransferase [Deltaproteobacteria bacterium]MBW2150067.1 DegT/DnrJ/EryC1/StrS family aminotransferase [Deltaproteobacteria bacterium]